MSLLDDVSIVVTPNGYKAGELYAVIPSDGAADMDVTRATAATRVDENGLVNYAEVIGGDLVNTIENLSNPFPTFTDNGGGSYTMATTTTAYSGFEQPASDVFAVQVGEIYKLTFDFVLNSGALDLELFIGSASVGSSYGNKHTCQVGSNTALITIFTSNSSARLVSQINQPANMTISNIVLKKVDRDNVPRIDYTGGGCPHILAEPQRTNTLTYSEDFSQFSTSGSPTLTTGQLAPDGTLGATKVSGTIGSTYLSLSGTTSATATRTIYAKTVSGTGTARLMSYFGNTDNLFNLTEEWQRFELTGAISTGAANFYVDMRGTQTLSEFIVWGGQSEEATYATSYIPTSGSTVTRNQDIFTRDGIGSLINSTEGVLFVEMAALADDGTNRMIVIKNPAGYTAGSAYIYYTANSNELSYRYFDNSGNLQASITVTVTDTLVYNKIAFTWANGNYKLYINGLSVGTNVGLNGNTCTANTLTEINFNRDGSLDFYGKVKQLQVYDTSLSDTQLAALTS